MSAEVFLDTRLLEPPEPLEQATAALDRLAPGQFLHMLHRMAPRLLYPDIAARGCVQQTLQCADDEFHIIIWPARDKVAERAALACCNHCQTH